MNEIVFQVEFDFYENVLNFVTLHDSVRDDLVDMTWDLLRDSMDRKEYKEYDELAGDRYLTEIELNGPTVKVIITDALGDVEAERKREWQKDWLDKIEHMTHYDVCYLRRFAPTGHPCFDIINNEEISSAFAARYIKLGKMTPEMSELIGWG